jgi:uncharacterized repeat protein (TIGR01451 family)
VSRSAWVKRSSFIFVVAVAVAPISVVLRISAAHAATVPPTYQSSFGTSGTGSGQLRSPTGLAIKSDHSLFVSEGVNNRVQHFDTSGASLGTFGTAGSGAGQMSFPNAVAVGPDGPIYVADSNNHRVERFGASGNFVSAWGSIGSGQSQFTFAFGVAVDASGDVYAVDGSDRVQRFSSDGTFKQQWGSTGNGGGQLNDPYAIAIRGTDVYVTERGNNRVSHFSTAGAYVGSFGTQGTGDGEFQDPLGIALDNTGNVYVADSTNNRIQEFGADGTFLTKWGVFGTQPGTLADPRGIAIDGPLIYVAETGNDRVSVFAVSSNSAPDVTQPADQSSNQGDVISLPIIASDTNGDTLSFTATGLPPELTIDPATGVISGTLSAAAAGSHPVTVEVSDGTATSSVHFGWDVNGLNHGPVATNGNYNVVTGDSVSVTLQATDPDGDALTYSVTGGPDHGTLTGDAPNLTYEPAAGFDGPDSFTFVATDGALTSDPATISVNVESAVTTVYAVNTNANTTDAGGCTASNCSLREAIAAANAHPNGSARDRIAFNVGATPTTVYLNADLPQITDPVVIDGRPATTAFARTAASASPSSSTCDSAKLVEINGKTRRNILTITGGNTEVRNLALVGSSTGDAVVLSGPGGNTVECNYIGVRADGGAAFPNLAGTSDTTTSGAPDLIDSNVIYGNLSDGVVVNAPASRPAPSGGTTRALIARIVSNTIGLGPAGQPLPFDSRAPSNVSSQTCTTNGSLATGSPKQTNGVRIAAAKTSVTSIDVGAPGDGNVISGNCSSGVSLNSDPSVGKGADVHVQANRIGPSADGTLWGNGTFGVLVRADNTLIGGTGAGEGNLISGNVDSESDTTWTGVGVGIEFNGPSQSTSWHVHHNRVLGNSIVDNGKLGIDIGGAVPDGPDFRGAQFPVNRNKGSGNDSQPFLDLHTAIDNPRTDGTHVTHVESRLDLAQYPTSVSPFRVEWFSNDECDPSEYGEGQTLIGSQDVTLDPGRTDILVRTDFQTSLQGKFITSTVTDAEGDTSEFSKCIPVEDGTTVLPPQYYVDLSIVKEQMLPGSTGASAVMSKNPVSPRLGDLLWYRLTAKNSGNTEAEHVVISDDIPSVLHIVPNNTKYKTQNTCQSTPASLTITGQHVSATCADVAPGESIAVYVLTRVAMECDIVGTALPDNLVGTDNPETICGAGAGDTIHGNGGGDTIYGNMPGDWAGRSWTNQGAVSTTSDDYDLSNNDSNQVLGTLVLGVDGGDTIYGGDGDDTIYGQGGGDHIFGDDGDDFIDGGDAGDVIRGGNDNDTINGDSGNDELYGDTGRDVIHGNGGADEVHGGDGGDLLYGDTGDDRQVKRNDGTLFGGLFGGDGNDTIYGGAGNDSIEGGAGDDALAGDDGANPTSASGGNDVVNGNEDDDLIYGQGGNDVLEGASGTDRIHGGSGSDQVHGGDFPSGANLLVGGGGSSDVCSHGPGTGDDDIDHRDTSCERSVVGGGSDPGTSDVDWQSWVWPTF